MEKSKVGIMRLFSGVQMQVFLHNINTTQPKDEVVDPPTDFQRRAGLVPSQGFPRKVFSLYIIFIVSFMGQPSAGDIEMYEPINQYYPTSRLAIQLRMQCN